jgi:L-ascorbate metabolism protein UlaG (beta-lactamase superfamily)
VDKSREVKLVQPDDVPPCPQWSRRHWLGATVGTAIGTLAAEAASLAGVWDHERPSAPGLTPRRAPSRAGPPPPPRLTHVGHACHLIEIGGQRWLTDPWFYDPAFGSLRHSAAIAVEDVGPLDGIFISHRHADHFDPAALARLDKRAHVWTADPSLLGALAELGFARSSLSQPWQTLALGAVELGFAPAVHDVPQHSLSLASSEARVLFCADTGPHAHWSEIRRRYRPNTALLPCDGTALRWEPRQIMNPEEAARAALDLGCRQLLQTHADARYSDPVAEHLLSSSVHEPVERLRTALAARREIARLPDFVPLEIGETRALIF